MNILLLLAHSIAEYDDMRMLTDLGHDVFSIGAYTDPANPSDDKRPDLPHVAYHPDLARLVTDQMAAKEHLPADLIDWADVIVAHHYVDRWLAGQWARIRPRGGKRVVWRTCGQSDLRLEDVMAPLVADGLEVVRYSPAEQRFFQAVGHWAGQSALIRFGKYVDDYGPWRPSGDPYVANVTQNMVGRGDWCGLGFWTKATQGLPARPAGPGSHDLPGGLGALPPDLMGPYLARAGAYLYTGTVPASYTLGLIEALLTGVPVVSMSGAAWMGPEGLWEASDLVHVPGYQLVADTPAQATVQLQLLLDDRRLAQRVSQAQRERAAAIFGVQHVGQAWQEFLGVAA